MLQPQILLINSMQTWLISNLILFIFFTLLNITASNKCEYIVYDFCI